jgi:alkylation response protein AidB-like acyl-CoA dehydrogenase
MTWWNKWGEQAALRSEIRECFRSLPPAAQHDPKMTLRELGGHGWIRPGASADGQGSLWTSAAVGAEYGYSWLPTLPAYLGNDIAGSTLDLIGTTLQRERFLPGISTGSLLLSLGYTEPDSGSDLASMRSVSQRQGTDYVVNGTKVFISFAEYADYLLLATRAVDCGDDRRAHTVLLVDTALPGVEITTMPTIAGDPVTIVSLSDVAVAEEMVVGEAGKGWDVLRLALDIERSGFQFLGMAERVRDEAMAIVKQTDSLSDTARRLLAKTREEIMAVELMCARVTWLQGEGLPSRSEASAAKVASTELLQRTCQRAFSILGIRAGATPFLSSALTYSTVTTVYGGTSEIQRNIIAQTLGLAGRA